jgi:hypothetical protein
MAMKIVAGLVAMALMLAYLLPPVFKLKETDLGIAIAIGLVLMLVDLWHSLQKDD